MDNGILLPPILLYAETHFRFFRFFPSLLFKKNPEVIFDVPRRLAPDNDLPVVLIINDIDRFPAECIDVKITISQKNQQPILFHFNDLQKNILEHAFSFQSMVFLFTIPRNTLQNGLNFLNCIAEINANNRTQLVLNDNLTFSSKFPFSCYVSNEQLPGYEFCSYGDLHVHSQYSQSHVEFGPPLHIIGSFSKCYGADFVCITDHSYDLACSMENYLRPDHTLPRWKSIFEETSRNDYKNIVVLGEEISCLNSNNKAVHLCAFGLHDYIPGTVDGARKNIQSNDQVSVDQALSLIHEQEGVAFAAHPGSKTGFMQRIFLKRGAWNKKDLENNIDGMQAVNNGFVDSWYRAKSLWIKELLKGHKLSLVAGNDCHGDFNRYRYLSIPFVMIREMFNRYLCSSMTGTYGKIQTRRQLIDILKNGKTFITTGPMLCISESDSIKDNVVGKDRRDLKNDHVTIILISNCEFGQPSCIRLFFGNYISRIEILFFIKHFQNEGLSVKAQVSISAIKGQKGYLRAEAQCKKQDGTIHYAATSPCYL